MPHRILLVEDDPIIIASLTELLTKEGYCVDTAATQEAAIRRALGGKLDGSSPYHLVLLDITLAEGSGFSVCAAIKRVAPQVPVIFLTAFDDEGNTVAGLELGADDYIPKPFRPRELLARVASTIRRSQPSQRIVRFGDLTVDTDRAHVERRGREIVLSALEYRLLLLFVTNPGRLVTREMMRDALWDDAGTYIEENTLSVYIKRLRDKIEEDPSDPRLIQTVRGLGYKAQG